MVAVPRGGQLLQIGQASSIWADSRRSPLGRVGRQQGMIAKLVHQPRHAVGGLEDGLADLAGKQFSAAPAGQLNLDVDVILGFAAIERLQVAPRTRPAD